MNTQVVRSVIPTVVPGVLSGAPTTSLTVPGVHPHYPWPPQYIQGHYMYPQDMYQRMPFLMTGMPYGMTPEQYQQHLKENMPRSHERSRERSREKSVKSATKSVSSKKTDHKI